MTDIAEKIIGVYIAPDTTPKPPTVAWVQEECLRGKFRSVLEDFVSKQDEPLNADKAIVEKIDDSFIYVKIPCKMHDHESVSAFVTEVSLKIDPKTAKAVRY